MIFFKLKGTVVHIYDVKTLYSTINEIQYFQKQHIIVQLETEMYTVCFIDKKIELLQGVEINSEVELDIKVKGRIWKKGGEVNSVNELVCLKLLIINDEKKLCQISYNNSLYDVKKYFYEGRLRMKIVNTTDKTEIDFSAMCDFMHESENKNHILFTNHSDKKILNILIEQKILENVYDIHQSGGASGYVCKLLI